MNDTEQQMQQVNISIDQAKAMIEMGKAVNRLRDNEDFVKVIEEGYFKEEASRLVLLKGDPEMQSPEKKADVKRAIVAIGGMFQYLHKILQLSEMAKQGLAADEQTREEMLQEQLEGDTLQ